MVLDLSPLMVDLKQQVDFLYFGTVLFCMLSCMHEATTCLASVPSVLLCILTLLRYRQLWDKSTITYYIRFVCK